MRTSLKLTVVALLALSIGLAYASPMLIAQMNIQPFPQVPQGPKADFDVNVVYANFNPVNWQYNRTDYDLSGNPYNATYQATNVTYAVVLNITNTSDQPAHLYEVSFAAAQNITVKQSILGGTIYDAGAAAQSSIFPYNYFGGLVEGVYLNNKWINDTWMPNIYTDDNGTSTIVPYPFACTI